MLSLSKLENGILSAMGKSREVGPADGAGAVEPKYSKADVAGFYADAVVTYVKDAEIMMLYGPFMFPNPAGTPPLLPDVAAYTQTVAIKTADVGKSALKGAFQSSFEANDPAMAIVTAGIIAYAATLTFFQGAFVPLYTATGATAMALPPIFVPVLVGGLAGMGEADCAKLMSAIIHASFKASVFNGVGTTLLLGIGPVLGQMLL